MYERLFTTPEEVAEWTLKLAGEDLEAAITCLKEVKKYDSQTEKP